MCPVGNSTNSCFNIMHGSFMFIYFGIEQFMLYICMYRSHMYRSHMYRSHMYRSHMYMYISACIGISYILTTIHCILLVCVQPRLELISSSLLHYQFNLIMTCATSQMSAHFSFDLPIIRPSTRIQVLLETDFFYVHNTNN